jgi:hypoxanthine phosphoribosyltransferase
VPTKKPAKKPVKPAKPSRPTTPRKPVEPDEFSASGGMPIVPSGLPATDFSAGKSKRINEMTWGQFDRHVQGLAREAKTFKPEAVVGLVHGGVFVGGALASALKVEFFPVRVTHRSRGTDRDAKVSEDMPEELAGRRVLVVDDIASSGDSIEFAVRLAKTRGAKAIKSAALIARPGRFEPDFTAVTADDFFVFPWDYQDVVSDVRFEPAEAKPAPKAARKK